ncbi:cytochrome c biogenesis protein CcsA [Methanonatronarchaeum sp. AMET6-2]|uniref:cytochrome c biogenesis protein CcsA n=1 Tax=Methanonatronarchaeum sp. AMET6-2 TaxID=2933293 RepID=UPI001FF21924|nr:cytochrome c biogenesis protein CcsA [Methanonatronarchaeum sp. AMET6-2]UOY09799.1 cytochrome c biogenesis protein CcsA [Methanonatronarchaeum sp. AMET6-2]
MIEPGEILLIIAFIGLLAVSIFSLKTYTTQKKTYSSWSRKLNVLSLSILTLSFLIFAYYCVTAEPDIFYSYAYGDPEYPWYYALSTIWAGERGSIFFWITIIAGSLITAEQLQIKDLDRKNQGVFRATTSLVLIGFIGILLIESPFEQTSQVLPELYNGVPAEEIMNQVPQGFAMSPILLNPWMAIHPPVIFLGYAFFTIPLAVTITYGVTELKRWNKLSMVWSRLGWIFLTLGIAIGAYWAYLTLGWGGYWAWDPVESASLLPWLTATALLHMLAVNKKKNVYTHLSHVFIIITFALIIFTTFVTRGGLPIEGPHTWGAAVGPVQVILILLMALPLVIGVYLVWRRQRYEPPT